MKSKALNGFLISSLLLLYALSVQASDAEKLCGSEVKPCLFYGAKIFLERCSICHGSDGMGEGILPLLIKDYPPTNLFKAKKSISRQDIRNMIVFGRTLPGVGALSPPWADELTLVQIDATTDFILYFRQQFEKSLKLLRTVKTDIKPSYRRGRALYLGRCVLCHGKTGEGDGKMTKIIHSPPPTNLALSQKNNTYLKEIIKKGGEALGRSSKMPPWGKEILDTEIESIILYLKTLR